jgi:hypothetical protein
MIGKHGHFFLLREIKGLNELNDDSDRKERILDKTTKKSFLYFWGFEIIKSNNEKDYVIYYCGVYEKNNIIERLMQHLAMLFGGYYTIINKDHLMLHNHQPRIRQFELLKEKLKQRSESKDVKIQEELKKYFLHTSDSLNAHKSFLNLENTTLNETLKWMKENMFFAYIEFTGDDCKKAVRAEKHIHDLLGINILGGRRRTLLSNKSLEASIEAHKGDKCLKLDKLFERLEEIPVIKKWLEEAILQGVSSKNPPTALGLWWDHSLNEEDFRLTLKRS